MLENESFITELTWSKLLQEKNRKCLYQCLGEPERQCPTFWFLFSLFVCFFLGEGFDSELKQINQQDSVG